MYYQISPTISSPLSIKILIVKFQKFFVFFRKPYTTPYNYQSNRKLSGGGLFFNPTPKRSFKVYFCPKCHKKSDFVKIIENQINLFWSAN